MAQSEDLRKVSRNLCKKKKDMNKSSRKHEVKLPDFTDEE